MIELYDNKVSHFVPNNNDLAKLSGGYFLNVSKLSYDLPILATTNFLKLNEQISNSFLYNKYLSRVVNIWSMIFQSSLRNPLPSCSFQLTTYQLTAILGSQSDRITLLELLSGRIRIGTFRGSISISGSGVSPTENYYECVAYIPQNFLFVTGLSYEEMLTYAARIRMKISNDNSPYSIIQERVKDILQIMNLEHCKDKIITSYPSLRGESGCELRRLVIAVEIIALPPFIFIDEPTNEFDPGLSVLIMKSLKTLSDRGHTVVCSVAKPNSEVFKQFNQLILLSEGFTIYAGPAKEIQNYFCGKDLGYSKSPDMELLDFLLDIVNGTERPISKRVAESPAILQEKFESSVLFQKPDESGLVTAFSSQKLRYYGYGVRLEAIRPMVSRAWILIERSLFSKLRDRTYNYFTVYGSTGMGLVIGYLQLNQGRYGSYTMGLVSFGYINTFNITALLFIISALNYGFPITQINLVCQRLALFRFELSSGLSTVLGFVLSIIISEFLFGIFIIVIFNSIIYWIAGINDGVERFIFFLTLQTLNYFLGVLCCYILGSILRKEIITRNAFLTVLLITVLLAGYVFPYPDLTPFWVNLARIIPVSWTYEACMKWKFHTYGDGLNYLEMYSFATFDENKIFEILFNFICVSIGLLVLTLLPLPNLLRQMDGQAKESKLLSVDYGVPFLSGAQRIESSGDEANITVFTPSKRSNSTNTRLSNTVKPIVFMRDSSVTGRVSKLSLNSSQVGIDGNTVRGPTIIFRNLVYRIKTNDKKLIPKQNSKLINSNLTYKYILDHVSGKFEWGKLSMIMGAPGSGKSTLIHILAGDTGFGTEISGDLIFDDELIDNRKPWVAMSTPCGLVELENEHLSTLTVQETIEFAFKFRNCQKNVNFKEKVQETIEMLHLEELTMKLVKDLTPGERKRLSIAEEMVNGPTLLLLDEPTNELQMEEQSLLLNTLRELVNGDRTVIAAIQNPTMKVFHMFDTLLLLSAGKVIYHGPVSESLSFFESSPFHFNFHNYTNPADYLTDISAGNIRSAQNEICTADEVEAFYKTTAEYTQIRILFYSGPHARGEPEDVYRPQTLLTSGWNSINTTTPEIISSDEPSQQSLWSLLPPIAPVVLNFFIQYLQGLMDLSHFTPKLQLGRLLFQRSTIALLRSYSLIFCSFFAQIILAVVLGMIVGVGNIDTVNSVLSFYAMSAFLSLFTSLGFAPFLYECKEVFLKEHARGLYPNGVHWLVSSIPLYILRGLNSFTLTLISTGIIGLSTNADQFGYFIVSFMEMLWVSLLMVETLTFMNNTLLKVYLTFPLICFYYFIFSGLFIKPGSLPSWLAWGHSSSLLSWILQGNFLNTYAPESTNSDIFVIFPNYSSYDQVTHLFKWNGQSKWTSLTALGYNILVWKLLTLFFAAISTIVQKGGRKFKRNAPEELNALL